MCVSLSWDPSKISLSLGFWQNARKCSSWKGKIVFNTRKGDIALLLSVVTFLRELTHSGSRQDSTSLLHFLFTVTTQVATFRVEYILIHGCWFRPDRSQGRLTWSGNGLNRSPAELQCLETEGHHQLASQSGCRNFSHMYQIQGMRDNIFHWILSHSVKQI